MTADGAKRNQRVEVAVALPVSGTYDYLVPPDIPESLPLGARVLVPFGARKVNGYVLKNYADDEAAETDLRLKPLADVIDDTPLFDEQSIAFLRWISSYYHAPLGEVIRTALPSALATSRVRRVRLTRLGERAAEMPGAEPVLRRLAETQSGEMALRRLEHEVPSLGTQLLRLQREGYLERFWSEEDPNRGQLTERVAVFLMRVPLPAHAHRAREVMAAIAERGEATVKELREELGDIWAQLRTLEARGVIRVEERRVFRTPHGAVFDTGERGLATPPTLTPEQAEAVDEVLRHLDAGYHGFLLHGVTGSGKTEVYLRLIAEARARQLGAIVLVPEIALTPQLVARFRARFGDQVGLLHSALSDGERLDQWERVRRGELPIVVGARSALFAPVRRLGLVVVDEEHEPSFKQEDHLRYNARDLALVRGQGAGAVVVLGSATPSLESAHNVRRGKLSLLRMKSRVQGRPLPDVELVDLKTTPPADADGVISTVLLDALTGTLAAGEQSLLFLNRRGYANFQLCRGCGHIQQCPHCSISLTYHHHARQLVCHYCDHHRPVSERCPKCHSTLVQPMGVGTEKIEATLKTLLPSARVARMDRDTTRGAALGELLRAIRRHEIDIVIGTQMVAKGHDFPGVTLVGVLLADQGLKFPDFRAAERTFQLLTQVAGRAGRGDRPGRVVVQTYDPRHYSLRHARHHAQDAFVEDELRVRKERRYPPFAYLALIRIFASDVPSARAEGGRVVQLLVRAGKDARVEVLGPTPAPIERVKGRVRWHVLVRAVERRELHQALLALRADLDRRRSGPTNVVIDVDPVSLL